MKKPNKQEINECKKLMWMLAVSKMAPYPDQMAHNFDLNNFIHHLDIEMMRQHHNKEERRKILLKVLSNQVVSNYFWMMSEDGMNAIEKISKEMGVTQQ